MSDNTAIQWTDATWNPTTGCTKISPGCANCYIERQPPFRIKGRKFDEKGHIPIIQHPDRLGHPYKWKEPRRVFVNSLSDLFHPDIPFSYIAEVFTTMGQTSRHQYQVLTKRPERLFEFYQWNYRGVDPAVAREDWLGSWGHVWFGVTVENRHFKSRITTLRKTPARVHFLSIEPLLEDICELDLDDIEWVVIGGESGPGSRTFDLAWARSILQQCRRHGVAPFMKQIGRCPVENGQRPLLRSSGGSWHFKDHPEDSHGGDIKEWPEDLRVREYPAVAA